MGVDSCHCHHRANKESDHWKTTNHRLFEQISYEDLDTSIWAFVAIRSPFIDLEEFQISEFPVRLQQQLHLPQCDYPLLQ